MANHVSAETFFKIFKRGQICSAFGTWIYNKPTENLPIHYGNLEVICIAWNVFILECYAQKGFYHQDQKSSEKIRNFIRKSSEKVHQDQKRSENNNIILSYIYLNLSIKSCSHPLLVEIPIFIGGTKALFVYLSNF